MMWLLLIYNIIYLLFIDQELRHREVKESVQGESACVWQRQILGPSCMGPDLKFCHFIQKQHTIFNIFCSFLKLAK